MTAAPLPVCLDVPEGARPLVAYGLEELLRGLGLRPEPARRGDARLVVSAGGAAGAGALGLTLTPEAAAALAAPRPARTEALGWVEIDAGGGPERWPLPVGPPGDRPALGRGGGADLVASAAWWLAGLQEAATAARDVHGRFPYGASLQAALGDAPGGPLRPAVDAYRAGLGHALRRLGVSVPGRAWGAGATWAVALTHDLDGLRTRRLRALAGALGRGGAGWLQAGRRALGPDVRWQSALALRRLARRHGARSTWFVKPAAWTAEDLPADLGAARVRRFLRGLEAEGHTVGWHPGYGAHDHPARLRAERARFADALGHAPRLARTHFLRWTDPTTPRLLARAGVQIDSTLGFSQHEGFRRGTSHPFRVFDVEAGRTTDLWEMPLAVMDTTLAAHRGLDAEGAAAALGAVLDAARRSGGCAVVLWHNDLGGDPAGGAGWSARLSALDHAVGRAEAAGAAVAPLDRLLDGWLGRSGQKTSENADTSAAARRSL
ncbi:hypothetical protein RQM47_12740 [Rubrivirga sp. S365]|uniref:hypothetical protein n=1 Tax=Rubrivirga sp. S365 TaxID=3076080 RepID=UPI0028C83110|nr:hypothetical protein [Rubrivirga sp. S365]MDT7857511.1 hypothetical protein [Rubrivirga sp. S365]